jgi:hypothetical protein
MTIEVPAPYVNNAWRSLIAGTYAIISGDDLNYSASNQYARKYAHESGEALRSLVVFGHARDAARMIPPVFVYRRPNIEYHDGAFNADFRGREKNQSFGGQAPRFYGNFFTPVSRSLINFPAQGGSVGYVSAFAEP